MQIKEEQNLLGQDIIAIRKKIEQRQDIGPVMFQGIEKN